MDYTFKVYAVPSQETKHKVDIKTDRDVTGSQFVCEPKLEYGFYYFMHQTKDKTKILSDPRYKNKYHITNPFEHNIPDYDKSIQKMSELYFGLSDNGIISRAFYKLWEVLMTFDILPEVGSIKTAHLAEAPGGFIQAVALYRQKFFKSSDVAKDTYHTISLKQKGSKYVPSFKNTMLDKLKQVTICDIEDCDIMRLSVQRKLVTETSNVDLVTADGGFEWKNENFQEQEAYRLIMNEILTAFRLQKQSGCFVLKIFDTFTDVTVKILALLQSYYKTVHVFKPLTSRPSNSEKYLVCRGFQGITPKDISYLEEVIDKMEKINQQNKYIVDIFPSYTFSSDLKLMNKAMSSYVGNEQFKSINVMIGYLNNGIFFGDDYHRFREEQIKANDFWVTMFCPINQGDFKQTKKRLAKLLEDSLNESAEKINELRERLLPYL